MTKIPEQKSVSFHVFVTRCWIIYFTENSIIFSFRHKWQFILRLWTAASGPTESWLAASVSLFQWSSFTWTASRQWTSPSSIACTTSKGGPKVTWAQSPTSRSSTALWGRGVANSEAREARASPIFQIY